MLIKAIRVVFEEREREREMERWRIDIKSLELGVYLDPYFCVI